MADKMTTTNILAVGIDNANYEKGTLRTTYIKIPNPKMGLTEAQIKAAVSTLLAPSILQDERGYDISTTAITTAYTETQEVIELDIGVES